MSSLSTQLIYQATDPVDAEMHINPGHDRPFVVLDLDGFTIYLHTPEQAQSLSAAFAEAALILAAALDAVPVGTERVA